MVCAGALVNPGDVIVGDADGVVVVPRALRPTWPKRASSASPRKKKPASACAKGELGFDFYGLRAKLKELGVEYVDELVERLPENGRSVVRS